MQPHSCGEPVRASPGNALAPGRRRLRGRGARRAGAQRPAKERQERTVAGAKAVAEKLLGAGNGVNVLTGGTDVHLILVDLRESELDGQMAEDRLDDIGITANMVYPPVTDTGWVTEAVREAVASSGTHFHVADPTEVAETVGFLVSDAAALVTGNVITLR